MAGTPVTIPTRKRLLVLKKVRSFLRRRSTCMTEMREPVVPCLALLKRPDRAGGYRFLQEYEFSPSRTPLIHRYHRKKLRLTGGRRNFKEDVRSLFVLCGCLGRGRSSGFEEGDRFFAAGTFAEPAHEAAFDEGGGSDSVDLRAEMFIRRFYEEMRMQRRLSI